MVKNSVDIVQAFFTQTTASISSDTLKHIIGMSEKRSTPAPETVTVRKNYFVSPPVPPLLLVWSSLAVFIFYAQHYGSVNLVFYVLIIFQQTGRL